MPACACGCVPVGVGVAVPRLLGADRGALLSPAEAVYWLLRVGTVCRRPGILCLVNDVDWELEGRLAYLLQPDDSVTFISTLHGG